MLGSNVIDSLMYGEASEFPTKRQLLSSVTREGKRVSPKAAEDILLRSIPFVNLTTMRTNAGMGSDQ